LTLFIIILYSFDHDLSLHAEEIYKTPRYPTDPLFYMCCPSRTDETVAPEGCENIFLLMPLAPGLHDTEEIREQYFNVMMDRVERLLGESLRSHLIYKKSYSIQDYIQDYHAYKGHAYGLANTAHANCGDEAGSSTTVKSIPLLCRADDCSGTWCASSYHLWKNSCWSTSQGSKKHCP
jgi:phytoene dehydrogenase-like protein